MELRADACMLHHHQPLLSPAIENFHHQAAVKSAEGSLFTAAVFPALQVRSFTHTPQGFLLGGGCK